MYRCAVVCVSGVRGCVFVFKYAVGCAFMSLHECGQVFVCVNVYKCVVGCAFVSLWMVDCRAGTVTRPDSKARA